MISDHEIKRQVNPWAEFATKQELHTVDSKVDELIRSGAGMAAAIQGLTKAVDAINENVSRLVTNKAIFDGVGRLIIKTGIWVFGTAGILTSLHVFGLIQIFGKWILSGIS